MPTYEYACKDCGTHLEVVQRFTDDPLTECHACGGRLRKVFGSIGIAFKGSGFYRTDSRATASSTAAGSPEKATGSKESAGARDTGTKDTGTKGGASKETGSAGTSAASGSGAKTA